MQHEIYEPNKFLKMRLSVWRMMFSELWEGRELIWRLFVRNLLARYKQSFLGYVWVLFMPCVAMGTFMLLNRTGILVIGVTDVPYPLFALIGLTVWQIFSTGVASGCTALVEAGDMIAKVSFPREALILAAMANALFEFLIKILLILVVCVLFRFVPPVSAIFLLVAIVPIVFLTLGLSLILSLVHAVFRDTAQAVSVCVMFLMFLTPVLYPVAPQNAFFFHLNPLTALVEAPRDIFIYGFVREPAGFAVASALSILVFLMAWRIFHLVETRIPERL